MSKRIACQALHCLLSSLAHQMKCWKKNCECSRVEPYLLLLHLSTSQVRISHMSNHLYDHIMWKSIACPSWYHCWYNNSGISLLRLKRDDQGKAGPWDFYLALLPWGPPQSADLMSAGTTFFGNSASRGGALYQEGGALIMRNAQLVDNFATTSGGSIYAATGALDIYNSTFRRNAASELPLSILQNPISWFAVAKELFQSALQCLVTYLTLDCPCIGFLDALAQVKEPMDHDIWQDIGAYLTCIPQVWCNWILLLKSATSSC